LTRSATVTSNPSRIILIGCQHPPPSRKEKMPLSSPNPTRESEALCNL
jgi:hypothetical protein